MCKCCATCYNALALLDGVANTQIRLERVIRDRTDNLAHDEDGSTSEGPPVLLHFHCAPLRLSLKVGPFFF